MYIRLLAWCLIFSLISCKSIGNLITSGTTVPYIRATGDVFLNKFDKSRKIKINVVNFVGDESFDSLKDVLENEVRRTNQLVQKTDEADVIITVNISNFYKTNSITMGNVQKQWIYNDTTDPTLPKEVRNGTTNIAEQGVAFSNAEHAGSFAPQTPKAGSTKSIFSDVFDRVTENDFLAGMTLGGVLGFFAFGSSPLLAIVFGLLGSAVGSLSEKLTEVTNFVLKVSIDVAEKTSYDIEYNSKYYHKDDQNSFRWHSHNKKEKWNHKRLAIYATIKKLLYSESKTKYLLLDKIADAISKSLLV